MNMNVATAVDEAPPLLSIQNLSKGFAGVRALDDVSFSIRKGEIHALLGENGAGKSTFIKVLTGVYSRDAGQILFEGEAFHANNSGHAQSLGVSTVYQEVNLIPTMTVTENLTLLNQPRRFGLISPRKAEQRAREMLERVGLNIDPSEQLDHFSIAVQQLIAIARALGTKAKLLILDEPTASLDADEVSRLFELMTELKAQGISIIFVTHFLDQVYRISDRITVLRNGQYVDTYNTAELPQSELIRAMVGKSLDELSKDTGAESRAVQDTLFAIDQYGKQRCLEPVDLTVARGEIVGLAGMLGSGRTELCNLIFGVDSVDSGEMTLAGQSQSIRSPKQAIDAGMAYCPEDRKVDGIVAELSVRENMILALQAKRGWLRPIPMAEQKAMVEEMIDRLSIKTPNMNKPIGELSGGNQQKVILARWLLTHPQLLLLDEPTRGIDVGAHHDIIEIMNELCEQGMSLLVASSELEELVVFAHRVAIMKDRRKVKELTGSEISQQSIVAAIAQ
ncbi:sugar ABC transporter ATP-binding protein [Reinekea blandensis]|uniref:Putative ATP-binding component of a transport system n=1 Tax=Reinekea blandensis MED297 TaxID=314283 RepID=A4BFA8_9GAMM|nr:sugar ABC transporter ATP-binding protein [Reinekea blandensis]EAR09221.1 putative ATP-binding component of a transport system [Reinekea sp. MED297] [Reinekea blandensis MED297]